MHTLAACFCKYQINIKIWQTFLELYHNRNLIYTKNVVNGLRIICLSYDRGCDTIELFCKLLLIKKSLVGNTLINCLSCYTYTYPVDCDWLTYFVPLFLHTSMHWNKWEYLLQKMGQDLIPKVSPSLICSTWYNYKICEWFP